MWKWANLNDDLRRSVFGAWGEQNDNAPGTDGELDQRVLCVGALHVLKHVTQRLGLWQHGPECAHVNKRCEYWIRERVQWRPIGTQRIGRLDWKVEECNAATLIRNLNVSCSVLNLNGRAVSSSASSDVRISFSVMFPSSSSLSHRKSNVLIHYSFLIACLCQIKWSKFPFSEKKPFLFAQIRIFCNYAKDNFP